MRATEASYFISILNAFPMSCAPLIIKFMRETAIARARARALGGDKRKARAENNKGEAPLKMLNKHEGAARNSFAPDSITVAYTH